MLKLFEPLFLNYKDSKETQKSSRDKFPKTFWYNFVQWWSLETWSRIFTSHGLEGCRSQSQA